MVRATVLWTIFHLTYRVRVMIAIGFQDTFRVRFRVVFSVRSGLKLGISVLASVAQPGIVSSSCTCRPI